MDMQPGPIVTLVTHVNEWQRRNEPLLIVVKAAGTVTHPSERHPAKAHSPVALQPTGCATDAAALKSHSDVIFTCYPICSIPDSLLF
jgi:hypothetical protein